SDLFFQLNSDTVFMGIFNLKNDNLNLINSIQDDSFIKRNNLDNNLFKELVLDSKQIKERATINTVSLVNINKKDQIIPFLGVLIPYKKSESETKVIISVLQIDNILSSFSKRGPFQTFMVDLNGNVLAHPEKEKVLFLSNLISSPIVKEMLKSPIGNGQNRFEENGEFFIGSFKKIESLNGGIISVVPETLVFEEVYNIQRRNIYISLISIFASLFITFLFSRTITKPLIRLVEQTHNVSKGDFKIDIEASTRDEIGLLTSHFKDMGKGLEEREKVKDALGRFVNPEIVKLVLNNELKLGGERRQCGILFSDIRSFTAMSEKMRPEEVVEFLNEYFGYMVSPIELTFGVVDKFIGDAIVGTWGAVNNLGNPAENSINAALMMRDQLIRMNEKRAKENKPPVRIGCGLNFGSVVAGQIGTENRFEYTVIGDTVNLASRLEALTKHFGADILITQKMYEEVKGLYIVEKMKQIMVKGKEDPQTVYAVISRTDDSDPNKPKTLADVRKLLSIKFDEAAYAESGDKEEEKFTIMDKPESK
ncbi:MAG: HAMP domain-containing protein, partial [Leptospiraceae bacterium]|nr:HAMP domain-containing protein [Leptospiraceae bacterium]